MQRCFVGLEAFPRWTDELVLVLSLSCPSSSLSNASFAASALSLIAFSDRVLRRGRDGDALRDGEVDFLDPRSLFPEDILFGDSDALDLRLFDSESLDEGLRDSASFSDNLSCGDSEPLDARLRDSDVFSEKDRPSRDADPCLGISESLSDNDRWSRDFELLDFLEEVRSGLSRS